MATYDANQSVHETVTGSTVDTVRLLQSWDSVELVNRGSAELYVSFVDDDPDPSDDDTYVVRSGRSLFVKAQTEGGAIAGSTTNPPHIVYVTAATDTAYSVVGQLGWGGPVVNQPPFTVDDLDSGAAASGEVLTADGTGGAAFTAALGAVPAMFATPSTTGTVMIPWVELGRYTTRTFSAASDQRFAAAPIQIGRACRVTEIETVVTDATATEYAMQWGIWRVGDEGYPDELVYVSAAVTGLTGTGRKGVTGLTVDITDPGLYAVGSWAPSDPTGGSFTVRAATGWNPTMPRVMLTTGVTPTGSRSAWNNSTIPDGTNTPSTLTGAQGICAIAELTIADIP